MRSIVVSIRFRLGAMATDERMTAPEQALSKSSLNYAWSVLLEALNAPEDVGFVPHHKGLPVPRDEFYPLTTEMLHKNAPDLRYLHFE